MAISKIQLDGQTLIDLSTDTVASSDDIVSGKIGHLNDGTVVTGTASGGGVVSGSIRTTEVNQGVISGSVSGDDLKLPVGKFSSTRDSSVTSLTASINCAINSVIICCFITRNCETPTLSNGWTLLSTSDINSSDSSKQRLNWATKIAESTTESITITQTASNYLYINMLALASTATITDNGYTYFNSSAKTFTVNKPTGLTIWGVSLPTRYQYSSGWEISNTQIRIHPSIGNNQFLLTSVDWSDDSSVTFTTNDTFSSTAIIGSLTVTGI